MIQLSNEIKTTFIAYAEAHNKREDTDQLFDAFIDQLESEYDYELSDLILDKLTQVGRDKNNHDIILIEANLRNINA
jgi:hypothetical protein